MAYAIAIDGPAGAGKSTIAKLLAQKLQFVYVDTGAMYRAMAVYFNKNSISGEDEAAINIACDEISIRIEYMDGIQQVILNDENVTSFLRTEETGKMASKISTYVKVRQKLVDLQQELAKTTDVVMDGRDIGTTVLPTANVKVYLTASAFVRAQRRCAELKGKGLDANLVEIQNDIEARDYQDMNREHSPLRQANDAILVDSSDMTIDEVVDVILNIM